MLHVSITKFHVDINKRIYLNAAAKHQLHRKKQQRVRQSKVYSSRRRRLIRLSPPTSSRPLLFSVFTGSEQAYIFPRNVTVNVISLHVGT